MVERPLFTVITFAYQRLNYTQLSLTAIMNQTYKNLQIIVVNNGATPEITDYLVNTKASDSRIQIIHYTENQFSYDDMALMIRGPFTTALKEARGEYLFYHADDDFMASDYVEKMVKLFRDNPNCTSAAGAIKCIDASGHIAYDNIPNYRSRYMPGHLLALSTLCQEKYGTRLLFSSPGGIFTFKREEFIKAGGYNLALDDSQLFGIVPFGVTGFDETAFFYWRHHEGQTNRYCSSIGWIGLKETVLMIKDWQIEERWQVYGKDTAKYVVRKIIERGYGGASIWFVINLYNFRVKACWRLLKDAWDNFYFWRELPAKFWTERKEFWHYLKPKFRRIFEAHPWLTQKFSFLMPFKGRVLK